MFQNQAARARRNWLEYEISAAITALKDSLARDEAPGEVTLGSENLDAILKREAVADREVRAYVGSKLFQAYQSTDARVRLVFAKYDLDYLGVSEDDFKRAISLADGEDWDVEDLTLSPRRGFLERFEQGQGAAEPVSEDKQGTDSTDALGRTIFLCHAEADKLIAVQLKDYFEAADRPVEVFVASHPESLPGGHEWWDDIRDHLKRARIVLTLVSSRSKDRPWLYFESGGGFFKGAVVIPLALPPERKSFPLPLGVLQGFDLGSAADVKALVKQLGIALSVTFARPPEDLAREIGERIRDMLADTSHPKTAEKNQPPWEGELRKLAAKGGTVCVHPVVPGIFAEKEFSIQEIEATSIGLRKPDSGHHISVPPYRVVGIRRDASGYVLDIQGRVQWVDADSSWHYMPEELQANDPHGLPREVGFDTEEVRLLIGKLKVDGWQVAFVHEPKAKAKVGRDYQLVYASDGQYLKVPDRPYAQVMVKYRAGAGP